MFGGYINPSIHPALDGSSVTSGDVQSGAVAHYELASLVWGSGGHNPGSDSGFEDGGTIPGFSSSGTPVVRDVTGSGSVLLSQSPAFNNPEIGGLAAFGNSEFDPTTSGFGLYLDTNFGNGLFLKTASGYTAARNLSFNVGNANQTLNVPVTSGNVASGQVGWPHITSGAIYGASGIVITYTGSGIRISQTVL